MVAGEREVMTPACQRPRTAGEVEEDMIKPSRPTQMEAVNWSTCSWGFVGRERCGIIIVASARLKPDVVLGDVDVFASWTGPAQVVS